MNPDDTVQAVHCHTSLCVLRIIIASGNDGPLYRAENRAKTVAVQEMQSGQSELLSQQEEGEGSPSPLHRKLQEFPSKAFMLLWKQSTSHCIVYPSNKRSAATEEKQIQKHQHHFNHRPVSVRLLAKLVNEQVENLFFFFISHWWLNMFKCVKVS